MSTARRRPRRAVRPSGTVGSDESVLRSTLPAAPPDPPLPAGRPAALPGAAAPDGPGEGAGARRTSASAGIPADGADDLWRATRSADDSDRGWGREEPSSNDDRLQRDKPPHW
ncbi:hypothetical protein J1G42_17175 [Cellulomonas sp. zg-ZUI222]|uniref:Uncharacterized protein n=1 Tax=Cellulomonas wangleii TaxID=2816956 RepID=A0ABX8DB93_9CELL|nr:hypothetical protein [Cellulomonas wangleii]MBO0922556.1 hypothetical protein [Cellulomonas wangleii]MBO0926739.1 hypothetical protein [Cellulomonas wangleii]QVI63147.1 hypothetical protein KG103_04350 [Cellulomonas wangleii]